MDHPGTTAHTHHQTAVRSNTPNKQTLHRGTANTYEEAPSQKTVFRSANSLASSLKAFLSNCFTSARAAGVQSAAPQGRALAMTTRWRAYLAETGCAHAATKAQVLVRWAVQRGFAPLPRSTAADAAQRLAIAQNAAAGVEDGDFWRGGPLSRAEMKALDALEDHLASGKLGRTDGWTADDVAGPGWDPTTYVDG
mgnify:CR=1 FL=1